MVIHYRTPPKPRSGYPKAGRITGHLEPVPSYEEYLTAWRATSLAYTGLRHRHQMDRRAAMDVLGRIPDHVRHEYATKRLRAVEKDFADMGLMGPEHRTRVRRIIELMEQGVGHHTATTQVREEIKARTQEVMADVDHRAERRHYLDTVPPMAARGIQSAALAAAGILAAAMWLYFF